MSHKKEIVTAIATLGCALGIGFVMQSGEVADQRYGKAALAKQTAAPVQATAANAFGLSLSEGAELQVESIKLTSAEIETLAEIPVFEDQMIKVSAPVNGLEAPDVPELALRPECTVTATATPVAAAMVHLSLVAPCLANEQVTIHHNGMMFSHETSATGTLNTQVPALAKDAVFILAFANGDGVVAEAQVRTLALYDRVVLQWRGASGFQIHAREFGADYGQDGHVWSGAAREVGFAATGEGGFLTTYGDVALSDALVAEVYSFPSGTIRKSGTVHLSIEAEVTASNCGTEVAAQVLELVAGGPVHSKDVTLAVPDCDAVGNFLVLNNLLKDLKVASN
ncbi:MAG: hypothetical protein WBC93_09055 [Sulfitobacter sp.]